MTELYPVYMNLEDKPCLVVGGGKVAARKIDGLRDAGARITVVALEADEGVKALAASGDITLHERAFAPADVDGQWLVFCATNREEVNRSVFQASEEAGVAANVADVPALCRFQVPGRFRKGRLQVAVSTRGGSPALSRRLRAEFDAFLSPWAPRLVEWMARLREELKETMPGDVDGRGALLNGLVDNHFESLKAWADEDDYASFRTLVEQKLNPPE